jgi:hypothetical protein
MKGFLTGIIATVLVWVFGWDRIEHVLDTADAATKTAFTRVERYAAQQGPTRHRPRRAPRGE